MDADFQIGWSEITGRAADDVRKVYGKILVAKPAYVTRV